MADIHKATSTYGTSGIDTYTTLVDFDDEIQAVEQNAPASAIVNIETTLGAGETLKGNKTDLVGRLAINQDADGKLKTFSATTLSGRSLLAQAEGGTGVGSYTALNVVRQNTGGTALEASGFTFKSGAGSGEIVDLASTQTLTAKTMTSPTLTTPIIGDLTNSTHDHSNAANGGTIAVASLLAGLVGSGFVTRSSAATATYGPAAPGAGGTTVATSGGFAVSSTGIVWVSVTGRVIANGSGGTNITLSLLRNGGILRTISSGGNFSTVGASEFTLQFADLPGANTHTYTLGIFGNSIDQATLENVQLDLIHLKV